jgi:CRISPR type III-A-associated RAMP protein Csm4
MKVVRFPLKPTAHFHFGEIAMDEKSNISTTSSFPHSDTLFSSLVNNYAQVHDKNEVDKFVEDFENGKNLISSMFYYLKVNEAIIYFLPVPLSYAIQEINREYYKKFKKIEFISIGVWNTIKLTNDFFKQDICSIIQDRFVVLNDEITPELSNKVSVYSKITQPKVPIRWLDENAAIYFETDVEIADNSKLSSAVEVGYYFLYTSDQEKELIEAIQLLGLSGIGGGRSTGTGELSNPVFEADHPFIMKSSSGSYCCLSFAIPAEEDEFRKFEYYETRIRGGRKMDTGKQKFIRMIEEGAIVSEPVNGKLALIGTDDHGNRVLRNGYCFLLPLT